MARLTVKATLDSTSRRFPIKENVTFTAFHAQLQTLFRTAEELSVTYQDSDGDTISVSSDIELDELFVSAKALTPPIVRVFLFFVSSPVPAHTVAGVVAAPPPTPSEDSAQVRSLAPGFSTLLASANPVETPSMDSGHTHPEAPATVLGGDTFSRQMPVEGQGRKRVLAGLRPFMSAFPSGKAGFRKNAKCMSPDVKVGFRHLVHHILNADDTWAIVSALKDNYPIMRTWIDEDLGGEDMPDAVKIDSLVAGAEAALSPRIGGEHTKRVIDYMRLALADEGMIRMLRELRGMGPMPWEAGFNANGRKATKTARVAGPEAARDASSAATAVASTGPADATPGENEVAGNPTHPDVPRKGVLSGLRPYISAFPSGRPGFRKGTKSVSPEVKAEFKKVVRLVVKSPDRPLIIAGLRDAFPMFRGWVEVELESDNMPSIEKVGTIAEDVKTSLLPKIGEEATTRVTELLRMGLSDEGVVNMLRKTRGMGAMPWEEGFVWKGKKASKGGIGKNRSSSASGTGVPVGGGSQGDGEGTERGSRATAPRKGVLAGLRPYISAFPSGKPGFRKSAQSVSPAIKAEFKKVARVVSKSPERRQIVSGLKDAVPILHRWIEAELEGEGMPSTEKVDVVVENVRTSLQEKAGEDMTTLMTNLLRKSLCDEAVVNMMRKTRGMGSMPWDEGFKLSPPMGRRFRGFDVHAVACSHCKTKPIIGSRFKCSNREGMNLCAKCFGSDGVSKDGLQFEEYRFVWEASGSGDSVPMAPLKKGDRGARVKFLQKVLTDLGFMHEGMYSRRAGLFGELTVAAVVQFQREQELGTVCEEGVYDAATAERLGQVIEGRNGGDIVASVTGVQMDEVSAVVG